MARKSATIKNPAIMADIIMAVSTPVLRSYLHLMCQPAGQLQKFRCLRANRYSIDILFLPLYAIFLRLRYQEDQFLVR
jgi:hypothetical protein